jgi:bifunctional non-homologous end joining protein LigD
MPISWDELGKEVRSDYFNVRNAVPRLRRQKADPWVELTTLRQTLDRAMMSQVGYQRPERAVVKRNRGKR